MKTTRLLALEYIIAVGVVSWAAMKGDPDNNTKYWPWPPTIVYTSIAFGILAMLARVQAPLANVLGAGFLLAQLVRVLQNNNFFAVSGIPNSKTFTRYGDSTDKNGNGINYIRILTL